MNQTVIPHGTLAAPALTYQEQLRDARWQRRADEVRNRENYTCENCRSPVLQLTVHHSHYLKGKMLWEHPDELLHCLCRKCHFERQAIEESLKIELMKALARIPNQRLEKVFWRFQQEAMAESLV